MQGTAYKCSPLALWLLSVTEAGPLSYIEIYPGKGTTYTFLAFSGLVELRQLNEEVLSKL